MRWTGAGERAERSQRKALIIRSPTTAPRGGWQVVAQNHRTTTPTRFKSVSTRGGKGEAHSGSVGPQVTFNRRTLETCFSSFPSHLSHVQGTKPQKSRTGTRGGIHDFASFVGYAALRCVAAGARWSSLKQHHQPAAPACQPPRARP